MSVLPKTRLSARTLAVVFVASAALASGCDEGPSAPKPRPGPRSAAREHPQADPPKPPPLARDGSWPVSREGLYFCFAGVFEPMTAFGADGRPIQGYGLGTDRFRLRDLAVPNRAGGVHLARGSVQALGAGPHMARSVGEAGAVSVELVVTPDDVSQRGPATIVFLGGAYERPLLMIAQDGGALILVLRTTGAPDGRRVELCHLGEPRPTHVLVSYRPGRLVCWKNGREVSRRSDVAGTLSNWSAGELLLGDGPRRLTDWRGAIERLAISVRAVGQEEAGLAYEAFAESLRQRQLTQPVRVRARLVASSRTPSPHEIAPHRRGLTLIKWRVEEVLAGHLTEREVYVLHWSVLDGRQLAIAEAPAGRVAELTLESAADHPELRTVTTFESLADDRQGLQATRYFDAGGLSLSEQMW